jgi:hypothetical protein
MGFSFSSWKKGLWWYQPNLAGGGGGKMTSQQDGRKKERKKERKSVFEAVGLLTRTNPSCSGC